jgi:hypothetical protein
MCTAESLVLAGTSLYCNVTYINLFIYTWNPTFPLKDIHKETWFSADSRRAKQIDHILISNRLRSAITDIRTLRGPDIGSDHNLLKINFSEINGEN